MGPLSRALHVEPGEGRLAGALFAVMLLTACGAGAGLTAADALLFARYGVAALPQLYLALGIVSFVCALGVAAMFGAARRERIYPLTLAVLIVALIALRLATTAGVDITYPVMWLGANVVGMLQGIVAWGVASWLCDARQAKRLFPVANAAKILGAIVGSAAIAPLVLVVRLEDLLLLWAATLALSLVIVVRVARRIPSAPPAARTTPLRDELLVGWRVVRASRLLRLLAVSLVLFSVLFFALALPFTRAARLAMPREDDLATFLGAFNASTTAVAFLASLLVANRFYARFGVVNAILGFTLVYLGGFVALALTGSFAVVAAARWLQLVWLAGMADAAYQALFNPVPPERRDQIRAFMEGVPGQAGIALAGILLIVGDRALDPRAVAIGGAVAATAATLVILRARAAYREALVGALRAGRPEPFLGAAHEHAWLLRDRASLEVLRASASGPDARIRAVAVQMLAEVATPDVRPALEAATHDEDPSVRAAALRGASRVAPLAFVDLAQRDLASGGELGVAAALVLARAGRGDGADALRAAAADPSVEVRAAAARAVAESAPADRGDTLAALARDPDPSVRRAARDALVEHEPARALALAEAALDDRDDEALDLLEQLPAARASEPLRRYAVDSCATARRYASYQMSTAGDGGPGALLAASVDHRRRRAARRAVRAAAVRSGRVAPPALLDGLESPGRGTLAEALETLESYVAPELARELLPIWEDRAAPADATGLRRDPDPWIQQCAAFALGDGGGVMPTLAMLGQMERVLFLHGVPLFARLDPADLQAIARLATERSFADGVTAFHQGDDGDALYVVVEGSLRVERDGQEIAVRGPGEVVGEMALVSDVKRSATVSAGGDTRTLRIARAEFESILRDRPETALGVIRILAERLREGNARAVR